MFRLYIISIYDVINIHENDMIMCIYIMILLVNCYFWISFPYTVFRLTILFYI